jgi:tetratricopeptide (TPR) repeat protein
MNADWQLRVDALWADLHHMEHGAFLTAMQALANERGENVPEAQFHLGSAFDSTGAPTEAAACYRKALELGLAAPLRRRATIQLASSLRNLGDPATAVALLRAEEAEQSDELDDAVVAFLALALADLGEAQEGLGLTLQRLALHLPRYQASLAAYGRAMCDRVPGGNR